MPCPGYSIAALAIGKHRLLHEDVLRGVVVPVSLRHLALNLLSQSRTTFTGSPRDETILLSESEASHIDAAVIWCCPGIVTAIGAGGFRPSRHAGPEVSGVDVWTDTTDGLDVAALEAGRQGCWKQGPINDRTIRQKLVSMWFLDVTLVALDGLLIVSIDDHPAFKHHIASWL